MHIVRGHVQGSYKTLLVLGKHAYGSSAKTPTSFLHALFKSKVNVYKQSIGVLIGSGVNI